MLRDSYVSLPDRPLYQSTEYSMYSFLSLTNGPCGVVEFSDRFSPDGYLQKMNVSDEAEITQAFFFFLGSCVDINMAGRERPEERSPGRFFFIPV